MSQFGADLLYAVRRLAASPSFTTAAVATLALGIGANTAIFGLVDGIVLRPLPFPDPGRLVSVEHSLQGFDLDRVELSYGTYRHLLGNSTLAESSGIHVSATANVTSDGPPERYAALAVTETWLPTLGVMPMLGRGFVAEDTSFDTPSVVILSEPVWRVRYGADPGVVGRSIAVNGQTREIVGVLPPGFDYPTPAIGLLVPMKMDPDDIGLGGFHRPGIARLTAAATPSSLRDELQALVPTLSEAYGVPAEVLDELDLRVVVRPLRERVLGGIGRSLWLFLGSVAVVLIVACANVANLFQIRAEGRHRELSLRWALGASRGRLARTLMLEAGLLGVVAGGAGILVGGVAIATVRVSGVELPRLAAVGVDTRVVAFAVLLTILTTTLFGWPPALRMIRGAAAGVLGSENRSVTLDRAGHRRRAALVVAQIALALVLLVGAALAVQSAWRLARVDPGYSTDRILTARILLPSTKYPDNESVERFWTSLVERVSNLPGVESAAGTSELPLHDGIGRWDGLYAEGQLDDPAALPPVVTFRYVTPGYFDLLRIPGLAGRTFAAEDGAAGAASVIVSQAAARKVWATATALGGRVRQDAREPRPWSHVVGVVADTLDADLTGEPTPMVYYPVMPGTAGNFEFLPAALSLLVRVERDPLAHATAVRDTVWAIDPELPIADVRTLADIVDGATLGTRFMMTLFTVAAASGVLIGAVGLYGAVAYVVSMRTREISLRLAVGASARDVLTMILRQGLTLTAAGVAVGTLTALLATRALRSLLYGVQPTDPASYVAAVVILTGVTILAVLAPASRAARVSPARGLHTD